MSRRKKSNRSSSHVYKLFTGFFAPSQKDAAYHSAIVWTPGGGPRLPSRLFTKQVQGDVMKPHKARTFLRAVVLLTVAISSVILAPAQTLTTIYSFTGTNGDGGYPFPDGHL